MTLAVITPTPPGDRSSDTAELLAQLAAAAAGKDITALVTVAVELGRRLGLAGQQRVEQVGPVGKRPRVRALPTDQTPKAQVDPLDRVTSTSGTLLSEEQAAALGGTWR